MIIAELQESDRPAWDAYVRNSAHGLPHHLSGWCHVMAETYGYDTHFLMATDESNVLGVLPLFIVRSFLMGSRAMTMPGGLCAESEEVAQALINAATDVARQAKVKQFVIQDTRQIWPGDLRTTSEHVHWVLDTRPGTDALWEQTHKNIRRQVRIGRQNGLTAKVDRSGDCLDDFYAVLSQFTHQVGTPVFGRRFLRSVVETFPDGFCLILIYNGVRPVAGYFQLIMGDTVYGVWSGTLREYLKPRATYLAVWEVIRDAADNGYRFLDMGRSQAGSNASHFKGQWGGVSSPVHQQVAAIGEQKEADSIAGRVKSERKFQRFTQVWSKLPFPVVQFLGPKLRRHVPFA